MRNMSGFGFPTTYGAMPVAVSTREATAPVAGTIPDSVGPAASGLVATKWAPPATSRTAVVMASTSIRLSPSTT